MAETFSTPAQSTQHYLHSHQVWSRLGFDQPSKSPPVSFVEPALNGMLEDDTLPVFLSEIEDFFISPSTFIREYVRTNCHKAPNSEPTKGCSVPTLPSTTLGTDIPNVPSKGLGSPERRYQHVPSRQILKAVEEKIRNAKTQQISKPSATQRVASLHSEAMRHDGGVLSCDACRNSPTMGFCLQISKFRPSVSYASAMEWQRTLELEAATRLSPGIYEDSFNAYDRRQFFDVNPYSAL